MENRKLLFRLSKLFPSSIISCHSQTLPDVADSSFPISKTKKNPHKNPKHDETRSKAPQNPFSFNKHVKNQSSPSNSGRWFTSSDEMRTRTEPFFSLSSNSGHSSRLRQPAARMQEEMKSGESAWCSFSSIPFQDAVPGNTDSAALSNLEATRIYYESGSRRRRNRWRKNMWWTAAMGDSMAVEKWSSDPYGDLMASMAEMIMERQMFGAEDLERLLFWFLYLNEADYEGIIIEGFSEICQTLFGE